MTGNTQWIEVRLNGKPMKTLPKSKATAYAKEIKALGKVTMVPGTKPDGYRSEPPPKKKPKADPGFGDFTMTQENCDQRWFILSDGTALYVEDSPGDNLDDWEELEPFDNVIYYTHVRPYAGDPTELDAETSWIGYNADRTTFKDWCRLNFGAVPVKEFTLGDKEDDWQMHSDFDNFDKDAIRKWLRLVPEFGDLRGLKV